MAKGSVSFLSEGRYQARAPGDRRSLGVYPTREEAAGVLALVVFEQTRGAWVDEGPNTFVKYAGRVLDAREADGYRTVRDERNRFKNHIQCAPFAGKAIDKIETSDISQWLRLLARKDAACASARARPRKLSRSTIKGCLTLVSAVFTEAIEAGVVDSNPCVGLRVRKKEEVTRERWGYLLPAEQRALAECEAIPRAHRLLIRIAVGTGLREGELCCLHLADVHVDGPAPHVIVRFGSPGKSPKNGKIRKVPLFGDGLAAVREWTDAVLPELLERTKSGCYQNAHGLLAPTQRGSYRSKGKPLDRHWYTFSRALKAAGVDRHLRWHDLRHTCAVSLLRGWWGHKWRLEEVCAMLGHSSISVTERYAHLAETPLDDAARRTLGSAPTFER